MAVIGIAPPRPRAARARRRHPPAARRRGQVRVVRWLPADAARPRGRAAGDHRALRHRRVRRGNLAAARRGRSTCSSSRARSRRPSRPRRSSSCVARRRRWCPSARAQQPAASRHCATWASTTPSAMRSTRDRSGSSHWRHPSRCRTTSPWTPSCTAAPSRVAQLLELLTSLDVGRRPQLPDEAVCARVQAPRQSVHPRRPGRRLPGPGHTHRLRRAVPVVRPWLLRLLRAQGGRQHRGAGRLRSRRSAARAPRSWRACSPGSPSTRRRSAAIRGGTSHDARTGSRARHGRPAPSTSAS